MGDNNTPEERGEKLFKAVTDLAHIERIRIDYLNKLKAEAYEDAAKIAQDESLRYAGKALLASDALADVAKAIRARAAEVFSDKSSEEGK